MEHKSHFHEDTAPQGSKDPLEASTSNTEVNWSHLKPSDSFLIFKGILHRWCHGIPWGPLVRTHNAYRHSLLFLTYVLTTACEKLFSFSPHYKAASWSPILPPQNNPQDGIPQVKLMVVDVEFCAWPAWMWHCSLRGLSKPALNKSEGCGADFFFF